MAIIYIKGKALFELLETDFHCWKNSIIMNIYVCSWWPPSVRRSMPDWSWSSHKAPNWFSQFNQVKKTPTACRTRDKNRIYFAARSQVYHHLTTRKKIHKPATKHTDSGKEKHTPHVETCSSPDQSPARRGPACGGYEARYGSGNALNPLCAWFKGPVGVVQPFVEITTWLSRVVTVATTWTVEI